MDRRFSGDGERVYKDDPSSALPYEFIHRQSSHTPNASHQICFKCGTEHDFPFRSHLAGKMAPVKSAAASMSRPARTRLSVL
ncbi:hypothetical protein MPL3365_240014 [Mesorhizobium plurifarium]|uniref:Uncharacterized protein n=1 Tax=Mesorhizobium plurifarium TaxID=69974 RepID=A0A090GBS0_MESPL|nr:hypothetical protein MPL3365_240014 [Mesorhizobium plurifarium]